MRKKSVRAKKKDSYTFRKRLFLNPASTSHLSYIYCEAESSRGGEDACGNYLVTLADCRRIVRLEFLLSTKQYRRLSLRKINLLIDTLTQFRDALKREIALIEEGKSRGPTKARKA